MFLQKLAAELELFVEVSKTNVILLAQIMAAIWLLNIINWVARLRLNRFGVIPRQMRGLIGIFTSTFLHKNFNHLFFNSIPLFALGLFVMSFGVQTFCIASVLIILIEGSVVWCVGRPGTHIGASALITGYFSYVLTSAYKHPTITSLFAAAIVVYYFGSIAFSIFPSAEKTSWESHLFGFLAGIATFFIMNKQLATELLRNWFG